MKIDIKKFLEDESMMRVEGDLLVKSSNVLMSKSGNPYVKGLLTDGAMNIEYTIFNCNMALDVSDVVHIIGQRNVYNGATSIILNALTEGTEPIENFRKFAPYGKENLENTMRQLLECLGTDNEIGLLVNSIYEERMEKILDCPVAIGYHHVYHGAFLQHTLEVAMASVKEMNIYNEMEGINFDISLGLAIALLHDIGKTDVYYWNGESPELTVEGKLLGHIIPGIKIVYKKAYELNIDINNEWFLLLIQGIQSHHGELEPPAKPMCPESIIVSRADDNSALLEQVKTLCDNYQEGVLPVKVREGYIYNRK